ncbi:hypothetical protein ACLB1T_24510 [Escherichia coli]
MTVIVNGDITQRHLPRGVCSGSVTRWNVPRR